MMYRIVPTVSGYGRKGGRRDNMEPWHFSPIGWFWSVVASIGWSLFCFATKYPREGFVCEAFKDKEKLPCDKWYDYAGYND